MDSHIKNALTDYYIGLIELDLDNDKELTQMKKRGAVVVDFGDKHKSNFLVLTLFKLENHGLRCLHNLKKYDFSDIIDLTLLKNMLPPFGIEIDDMLNGVGVSNLFKYLFDINRRDCFEQLYEPYEYYLNDFYIGTLYFCKSFYDDFRTKSLEKKYINIPQYCLLTKSSAKIIGTDSSFKEDNYIYNYLLYKCLFLKCGDGYLNLNNNILYTDNIEKMNQFELDELFSKYLKDNHCQYADESVTLKKALTLFKKYNK